MDKVIIDGIDISGCPFYQYQTKEDYEMRYPESGDCEIGLAGYLFDYSRITEELEKACIDNPNCYYKQLKRLQAENEQLKKSIDRIMQNKEIKTIDSEIALLNAELQQENKRLKARLRPLEDSYFKGLSSIEIAELAKKSIKITAENRKLEYAIQEIRDIINAPCDNCKYNKDGITCSISDCGEGKLKIIENKINEVIGEE
jgi:hypothetical protein